MTPEELDAWKPQEPPRDFAARVVAARGLGGPPGSGSRAGRVAAGVLLVASLVAVVSYAGHVRGRAASGEVAAERRQEVRVGARATAVLEPGTRIRWRDDVVEQSSGESFWRVEPGARFVVRTPEGEVSVMGTCFRVKVLGVAALTAAVVVVVYEGKVLLSRRGTTVALAAGETARADARGVSRVKLQPESEAQAHAEHAVAALDRARADRMRAEIRALLAEAGPEREPVAPVATAKDAGGGAFPTMPVLASDGGDGGDEPSVDPKYIQQRVRDDLFPLAKQCYTDALGRDPKAAGTIELAFTIMGDPKVGGVVGEASLGDKTTLADHEMQTCIRESMMSVTFDAPPRGGEITVRYPIVFSPEDDDGG